MRLGLYYGIRDGVVGPLFRLLYRVHVEGSERVPEHGPAILAANHESLLDPFALALATRRPVRFFAKDELWQRRWLAPLLDALGGIRVYRGRGALTTIAHAEELLRADAVVGVFPQGRIRRDDGRWEHGPARLALETGTPVVPVRIVGTAKALARWRIGLPRIRVVVGEPIPVEPARPTVPAEHELIERLRHAVGALAQRSGAGVEPTQRGAATPHRF